MRKPSFRRSAEPPAPALLRVQRVGADGDGVGSIGDERATPIYVPFSLPGETVRASPTIRRGEGWGARLDAVLEPSPARVAPPCSRFGACGGCTLQHWRDAEYIGWKQAQLAEALRRAGFAGAPPPAVSRTPPGARRRMDWALRRTGSGVSVGLHRRHGAEIVDVEPCVVLHPALRALVAPLRALLTGLTLLRRDGSAIANLLDPDPDLLLRTDAEPSAADRAALAEFARAHGVARIHWAKGDGDPEPVCLLRPATVRLGGVAVTPSPGAFLQASTEGERAIVAAVLDGLPDALPARARIVELFAGCGTIGFALTHRARIVAFEGDPASVGALRRAANDAGLSGRVAVTERDLARQPLAAEELAGAAAVVLDPPWSGAAAQMPALAAARLARIIYVSCNPAALARDARMLAGAGYAVVAATLVDQFLWSSRIESVVVFGR